MELLVIFQLFVMMIPWESDLAHCMSHPVLVFSPYISKSPTEALKNSVNPEPLLQAASGEVKGNDGKKNYSKGKTHLVANKKWEGERGSKSHHNNQGYSKKDHAQHKEQGNAGHSTRGGKTYKGKKKGAVSGGKQKKGGKKSSKGFSGKHGHKQKERARKKFSDLFKNAQGGKSSKKFDYGDAKSYSSSFDDADGFFNAKKGGGSKSNSYEKEEGHDRAGGNSYSEKGGYHHNYAHEEGVHGNEEFGGYTHGRGKNKGIKKGHGHKQYKSGQYGHKDGHDKLHGNKEIASHLESVDDGHQYSSDDGFTHSEGHLNGINNGAFGGHSKGGDSFGLDAGGSFGKLLFNGGGTGGGHSSNLDHRISDALKFSEIDAQHGFGLDVSHDNHFGGGSGHGGHKEDSPKQKNKRPPPSQGKKRYHSNTSIKSPQANKPKQHSTGSKQVSNHHLTGINGGFRPIQPPHKRKNHFQRNKKYRHNNAPAQNAPKHSNRLRTPTHQVNVHPPHHIHAHPKSHNQIRHNTPVKQTNSHPTFPKQGVFIPIKNYRATNKNNQQSRPANKGNNNQHTQTVNHPHGYSLNNRHKFINFQIGRK